VTHGISPALAGTIGARAFGLVLTMVVGVLVAAPRAAALDDVLMQVRGISRLCGYDGWLVFSVQDQTGSFALQSWHDGTVAPVDVATSWYGFDHDVGPDDRAAYVGLLAVSEADAEAAAAGPAKARLRSLRRHLGRRTGAPAHGFQVARQRVRPVYLEPRPRVRSHDHGAASSGLCARPTEATTQAPGTRFPPVLHKGFLPSGAVEGMAAGD
jgi:hypothetical protein